MKRRVLIVALILLVLPLLSGEFRKHLEVRWYAWRLDDPDASALAFEELVRIGFPGIEPIYPKLVRIRLKKLVQIRQLELHIDRSSDSPRDLELDLAIFVVRCDPEATIDTKDIFSARVTVEEWVSRGEGECVLLLRGKVPPFARGWKGRWLVVAPVNDHTDPVAILPLPDDAPEVIEVAREIVK